MSRNVLLVTVDSLRADHCGFSGETGRAQGLTLTPTVDRLAANAVTFTRALSPGPRTPSSMPAVFTGEFFRPDDLAVYRDYETKARRWQDRQRRIADHMARFRSLAQRLRGRGYSTAGVTANPWTTRDANFHQGFDEFHAVATPDANGRSWYAPIVDRIGDAVGIDWEGTLLTWPDFYGTVRRARASLSEPYFLWLFVLDPHQPYIAPREYRTENTGPEMLYANARYNYGHGYTEELPGHLDRRLRRSYRDTVRSVDGLVDRLRRDFATDDPVTVFHADHGEALGEHGTVGHRPQLYRENVHVPLFVHGLDRTERVDDPVSLRSLPDVVVAAADDGLDPTRFTRPFVVSRTEECERIGVRSAEWSYQTAADGWEYVHGADRAELYRLGADPDEQRNVVADRPDGRALFESLVGNHEEGRRERDRIGDGAATIDRTVTGGREVSRRR